MADEVNQVQVFWENRKAQLTSRADALRTTDLPAAVTAAALAQGQLASTRQAAATARKAAEAARAAMAKVAMPADTTALEADWQTARLDLAQAEANAAAASRGVSLAQAAILGLQTELAYLTAATAEATTRGSAAGSEAKRLEALKLHMGAPGFVAAQGKASTLVTQGNTARTRINKLLPDKVAAVLTALVQRDETLRGQMNSPSDAAMPAAARRAQELAELTQAAEAMTAGAAGLVAEAQPLFDVWKKATFVVGAEGAPVTQARRDLLDDRANAHDAGLTMLADLADKLAILEAAEMALAAAARNWPPPGDPGFTAAGPNVTIELAAVAAARANYDPDNPAKQPALDAREALVQVPDDWAELSQHHRDLMHRLGALKTPLGKAGLPAAVTALSAAVAALATALGDEATARDQSALHASQMAERRAAATALGQMSDARLALVPGGILTPT